MALRHIGLLSISIADTNHNYRRLLDVENQLQGPRKATDVQKDSMIHEDASVAMGAKEKLAINLPD